MKKNKKITLNILFAFLLQITNILFPLFTIPYVSHTLGVNNLGKVDFSISLINWAIIFATCGITTYGIREVSKVRDNKNKLNKVFNELLLFKIISSIVITVVYLITVIIIDKTRLELLLFITQGLIIILNIFQFDWYFQAIENYKFIAFRSLLFKVIAFLFMFVIVKESNDYINYAIILIIANHFGNLINLKEICKNIKITFKGINIKRHIPKLKIFFISSLIISMYNIFDTIILGFIKNDYDVALFTRARVFLNVAMVAALSLSNAIMPRLNNYVETNKEKYISFLNFSVNLIYILTIPMMVGSILISKEMMLLFGGEDYLKATIPFIIISPLIIIVPLSTWIYQQIIVANNLENKFLKHQVIMAIISLILNIILDLKYGYVGTAITYLIVETYGFVSSLIVCKNKRLVNYFSKSLIKYIISVLIMSFCILIFKSSNLSWINVIKTIIIGVISYLISLFILKEDIIIYFINQIKFKFGSK